MQLLLRCKVVSSDANASMATTHFEVIGVISIDKIGVRHFRKEEIENSFELFESTY